jgi:hypothetical protein
MKRAGWYLIAGAAAGFAGVLGLHSAGTAAPAWPGRPNPAGPGAAPAPGSAPAAARGGPARHATGAVEPYGYGQLSVAVTVRGGQIVAVSVPVLHTVDPYSQQLAEQVIPELRSEVLAGHSAQIHAVSGATFTSEAYAQSIQSALDKLHGA